MIRTIKASSTTTTHLNKLCAQLKASHCKVRFSDLANALLEIHYESLSPQNIQKLQNRFFDEQMMIRNLSKSPKALDEKAKQTLKALSDRIRNQSQK